MNACVLDRILKERAWAHENLAVSILELHDNVLLPRGAVEGEKADRRECSPHALGALNQLACPCSYQITSEHASIAAGESGRWGGSPFVVPNGGALALFHRPLADPDVLAV